jgi:hypothetical protein
LRLLEMKLQRFSQISERLFFGLALAGDIKFEALGDVPISFSPNSRGEWDGWSVDG